ncbi:MAG: 3-keto-disaccharide hydrolase [Opitutaceae bacterium]
MRRFSILVLFFFLVGGPVRAAEPQLEPIFNGRDLTGWHAPDKENFWRVEDGILVGESVAELQESYLWTGEAYGDFILEFDARWTGEIDSGVQIRMPILQLQLGTSRSLERDMTGSFYVGRPGYPEAGQAKSAAELMHPEGEWNTFRLEARGDTFTVWINGRRAARYTNAKFSGAGPISLQIHGGLKMKIEFRNIRASAL